MKLAYVVVILCYLNFARAGTVASDTSRVKAYGAEIRSILVNKVLDEFTGLARLIEKYQSLDLKWIELNSAKVVEEKVSILKKVFKDREELVKRIAEEAEKLRDVDDPSELTGKNITFYKSSEEQNETESNEFETEVKKILYRNAKCNCNYQRPEHVSDSRCNEPIDGYKLNRHFGIQPVSFENTSVHIPTEIYNEDPDVLKDIYLSHGIDEVMRREVCSNNTYSNLTRWVYFTTHHGIMRFFPDRVWSDDCEVPDVFDSRISQWFLTSVSSPKDITILIDNSGSVEGLTLNLLHRSVHDFLDTLTTDDFVNIVLFNEEAKFIKDKCTGLLQATPRNKQLLQNWMYRVTIQNQSDYERGFDLALKTLDSTSHADVYSAKCNSLVVFFTDGDAIYPSQAMERWNKAKDKRVFSYIVGKNFYAKETTKEIACRNRGYYDSIPSYTATKSTVQHYLVKISEPLMDKVKTVKWTLPYRDYFGLGFVISASVSVHQREEKNLKLVGIVGTDILLLDLKKIVTDSDMGHDYYPFIIDNNGFAVIHPNLVESNHNDVMSVDFLDLEDKNMATIRNDIIDEQTGTSQLLPKEFVLDGRYLITSLYKYSYKPIEGTKFKFGLGAHNSKLKSLDATAAIKTHYHDLTLKKLIDEQTSNTTALLYSSPCVNKVDTSFNPCEVSGNSTDDESDKIKFQDGIPLSELSANSCDISSQSYSGFLLHTFISDEWSAKMWDASNTPIKNEHGVLALYTALETPSFLRMKFLNFTKQTNGSMEIDDDQVKLEIKQILANPRDSTYLRRAIHKPEWTIYYFFNPPAIEEPIPIPSTNPTSPTTMFQATTPLLTTPELTTEGSSQARKKKRGYILASKVVQVTRDEAAVTPVVTGVVLHPDTFQKNLFSLAYKCNGSSGCNADKWDLLCNDTENVECLILDDGGYLISSNQGKHLNQVNEFFGLIDGEFMRTLVNQKVYDVNNVHDYQAVCTKKKNDKSAGIPRCFVPTVADLLSFGWWLSSCAHMFFYSFFQSAILGLWSFFDLGFSHIIVPEGSPIRTTHEQCILKSPIVSFGPNRRMLYGTFGCTEFCERSFTSVQLEDTNLLLIVAETDVICREDCSKVTPFSNEPADETLDETCNNETARYRKPPDQECYDARTLPKELDSACSSAQKMLPFFTLISVFAVLHPIFCCYFS